MMNYSLDSRVSFRKYDSYKDSRVEWLGEIPEDWKVQKMKFLGEVFAGITDKKGEDFSKEFKTGFKPFIPFTNICNNIYIDENQYQYVNIADKENQKQVEKGDLLFLMSSETSEDIGLCALFQNYNKSKVFLNSFCKGFRLNNDSVIPSFLNYLMLSKPFREYYSLMGKGFTRINLKQEHIKNAPALLPPKQEQTAIAGFLDEKCGKIDAAIAQKQKLIELLKERKQIIIQNAVTKGLDPNVKMKNSGVEWIGEIPEHWEVKKIKYLGRLKSGDGITNSELKDEGKYEVFGGNGLMGYSFKFNVQGKNIIIGRVGAYCGNIRLSEGKRWISDNALILSLENKELYEFISSTLTAANLNNLNTSSAQPLITGTKVSNFSIPFPPFGEQNNILENIDLQSKKIDRSIDLQHKQIKKLKEYKSSLIDAAVTGKIKVTKD